MKAIKIKALVLVFLLSILATPVQANASSTQSDCSLPTAPDTLQNVNSLVTPNIEPTSARIASITVKVNSPCDDKWRETYPNTWMSEANTAVEAADDQLYEWFGIDFVSVAQNTWTSPSSGTSKTYIDDAINDVGLKSGAQIMIAFSGASPGAGGVAYMNSTYCVVFDQGTVNNGWVIRHEVGHLYGCPDEYNTTTGQFTSKVCLMNNCYSYYDTLCSSCMSIWDSNKDTK